VRWGGRDRRETEICPHPTVAMTTHPRPREGVDGRLVAFSDRHHLRVVAVVAGLVGDRHVAEDLAQEAFLRLHLHWDRVQHLANPEAWLYRVASNLANSWWRRRFAERRANRRHGPGATASYEPDHADVLAVRAAVAALPTRQRTVVVLRYFGGCSVAEAAEAMRCREGTVKSLTHRATHALRTSLGVDPGARAHPGRRADRGGPEAIEARSGAPTLAGPYPTPHLHNEEP